MGEMVRHKILFPGRDCILVITHQCYPMLTSMLGALDRMFSELKNIQSDPLSVNRFIFSFNNMFKLTECEIEVLISLTFLQEKKFALNI